MTAAAVPVFGEGAVTPCCEISLPITGPKENYAPRSLFAAAFGAGVVAGTWKPHEADLVGEGYRSVITQAGFGFLANWVGEFAPDAKRILRRKKGGGTSMGKN